MFFKVKQPMFGPIKAKMSLEAKELEKYSNVIIKKEVLWDITKIWKLISCMERQLYYLSHSTPLFFNLFLNRIPINAHIFF